MRRVIISVLKQLDCAAPLWGTITHARRGDHAAGARAGDSDRSTQPASAGDRSADRRPMPRSRMPPRNRSTRSWPARKFCTLSGSSLAPGATLPAYWIGFIVMAEGPVLITGGAGFIALAPDDALLATGHSVRILDDLSTGKRSNLPLDNPRSN
jgi:hypothetical protein